MHRIATTLLLPIALAVALLTPSTARADDTAPPTVDRRLSVATFNIHHGVGTDDQLNLARIAAVIADNGMDVVGLQEVDVHWSSRSDLVDQATWLAERLDMHVAFGANLDRDPARPGDPRRQYGTAILSRFPILDHHNTLLPRPEMGEQRGLLQTEVMVRGVRMRFLNTHLQHNSRRERMAQAAAINDIITTSDIPTVLVGDLNAPPAAPPIERLTTYLADTWPTAGTGDGFTYGAEAPHKRIDYVLASDNITAETAEVIDTGASDHLPVLVDIVLHGQLGQ